MSIALLGLVSIQYLWISNAIRLKNEEFDRRVYAALNTTIDKLEFRHGLNFFADRLKADSTLLKGIEDVDTGFSNFIINTENITNENGEDVRVTVRSRIDSQKQQRIIVQTKTRTNGPPEQNVTVEALSAPPEPPLPPQLPALPEAEDKKEKFLSIIACAADEYAVSKTNWIDLIDTIKLLAVVTKELAANQLPEEFRLELHQGGNDSLLYASSKAYKKDTSTSYCIPVIESDAEDKAILLSLDFPGRTKFILASLIGLLALSVSFTVIVIAVFAMALWLILRQKKVNEITNDFINNMTHELKTPLATIGMTADTLKLPSVNANAAAINEYASLIKEETKKLSAHVDRILEAALTEEKNTKAERVELKPVIEQSITHCHSAIESLNGKIVLETPDATAVKAEAVKLGYVIDNLLDNAIKYSQGAPDIVVKVSVAAKEVTISVSDKGIGISKGDQKLVFDKFYRVHTGNRHDVKGFGLGLSFVKNSVESWGGRVWVESESGKGSTFVVVLKRDE